jgi:hypothetical protein
LLGDEDDRYTLPRVLVTLDAAPVLAELAREAKYRPVATSALERWQRDGAAFAE